MANKLTQISTAGVKDDAITDAKLPADSVGNSEMKDDAVGIAELSASGTASSSTFLRGDNSWATPAGKTTEEVQDIVGAMFTGNTETNITATYQDSDGTIDLVSTDTNTQLTTEEVQDIVGAMFTGNTETRISATYEDSDGTIDLVVDDQSTDNNTTYSISCVDGDNSDEEKIRLTDSGSGTDDVVLEAGTGLSIARSGDKITFTNTVSNTNTQLSTEEVQDIVGAMVSGNTETNIAVTYDDTNGKLDFVSTDTNTPPLTTEEVQDIVGGMFTGNTETNITATYEDSDGTIDLVSTDTNTQLSTEEVQDIVGAMFTGNTETNITATYEDSDGTIDLVVSGGEITVQDEGSSLSTAASTINFVGSGVTASGTGATKTITISGGSSATDFQYLELKAHNNTSGAFSAGSADYELVTSGTTTAVSPSAANTLLISVAGVIQKPNTGTSIGSNDGFCIDGSSIHFGGNLAAHPDFIIYQLGAGIGTPSDGTVTTAKLAADAVTGAKIADDSIDSEHIVAGAVDLEHMSSESVDEDNLQISNAGSNGQFLQKQSGNTGGLTWADAAGSVGGTTGTDYNDDVKVRLGTGNDLELFHSSDDSYISNVTNTDLIIRNIGNAGITLQTQNSYNVELKTNAEDSVKCVANGAVELYYDNSKKLETTTNGVAVTGSLTTTDEITVKGTEGSNGAIQIWADEGDDNADKWRLLAHTGGAFQLQNYTAGSWENSIGATGNGSVELYNDNKLNLATTGGGVKVSSPDGEATLQIEGYEGNAASLQLNADEGDDYNDFFRLRNNNNNTCSIESYSGGSWQKGFQMTGEGSVELYYDSNMRCKTSSTGINVNGGASSGYVKIETSDGTLRGSLHGNSSGYIGLLDLNDYWAVRCANNGETELRYQNSAKLATSSSGVTVTGSVLAGDGSTSTCAFGNDGDSNTGMYFPDADEVALATGGTQRLRVNSDGRFNCPGIYSTTIGETNRDVYAESNGNLGYTSSIRASKINIADLTDTSWVFNLQPKTFNYRKQDANGDWTNEAGNLKQWGLIAEEVESVEKDLCFYDVDGETETLQGINYSKLITPLIKIVQDQKAEIDILKTKVAALEAG